MASFFSSKPSFGIIFDIGPASVGAGLARFKEKDLPQVIYAVRKSFPLRDQVDAKRFMSDMISALKHVNEHILKESAGLKISHIVYSLSSPWSAAQTKTVSMSRPKPFTLTPKILNQMVAEQEMAFEKEGFGRTLNLSNKLSVIEKRLVDIKLDGKVVESPYETPARKADMSLFLSIAPKMILDEISDAAIQTYHPRDTKVFSFPLIAYSMTRDLFHEVPNFISLVIGGEVSDVSIIKNGLIVDTASFPIGSHFLVRDVAKAFSASLSEADSILNLYFKGHSTKAMADRMESVLALARDRFVSALNDVMAGLTSKDALPKAIFVTIDGNLTSFFIKTLEANPNLEITLLNPEKLRDLVIFFPRVRKDPFIALIAAFINKSRAFEVNKK